MEIEKYMECQPIINIGVIGHVMDGKSTIVQRLTNIKTQKHSNEKERNITIRLGYANAKIAKCDECEYPECYSSFPSDTTEYICEHCESKMELQTHVSFVDAPGHNMLMQVMLNGTCAMDYTLLIESVVNNTIPASQTVEHLEITNMMETPNVAVCMNKIDLVERDIAKANIDKLKEYLITKKVTKDSPIIPISGTLDVNIDVLCSLIANIPKPIRIFDDGFKMIVIRSFNVNMPGIDIREIKGGVLGGSIVKGCVEINDEVLVVPGFKQKRHDKGETVWKYTPLKCKVLSINSDKTKLLKAIPGGLIGVQLDIDPSLTYDNKMVGQVVLKTDDDKINNVYELLKCKIKFMKKGKLQKSHSYIININANNVMAKLTFKSDDKKERIYHFVLDEPVYMEKNDKITISVVKSDNDTSIVGLGVFIDGDKSHRE